MIDLRNYGLTKRNDVRDEGIDLPSRPKSSGAAAAADSLQKTLDLPHRWRIQCVLVRQRSLADALEISAQCHQALLTQFLSDR